MKETSSTTPPQKKRYRLEIEGLRAVAAILVAVYHIWFNRVSGGVDVFFVISGFLITSSIYSSYRKKRSPIFFSYIVKLLKRLIPTAWTVAIVTFFASVWILPTFYKPIVYEEVIASLFYFENWTLAFNAIDYLDANNEASPFQHFWALSIQFQFYLIWLVLFLVAFFMMKLFRRSSLVPFMLGLVSLVVLSSFAYSVYFTNVNQPFAYYHTFTRVWEFGVGGLLAFTLHRFKLSQRTSFWFGWFGFILLLSVGIIFQVSTSFPGYHALFPVLAATYILLAGQHEGKFTVYRLLSSKPFVHFGSLSYAFYLWHWPLLIFLLSYTNRETATFVEGLFIIIASYLLAFVTIFGIEKPLRSASFTHRRFFIATGAIGVALVSFVTYSQYRDAQLLHQSISVDHPGASVSLLAEKPTTYAQPPIPDLAIASQDRSTVYQDLCINADVQLDATSCEYGETENYIATIALIGGSHSAHWQPMLHEFGQQHGVRITTYLKGRCRFSLQDVNEWEPCDDWMRAVMKDVAMDPPDLVFSVGDISMTQFQDVPSGFLDAWDALDDLNIPLLLVRDTPRYEENVIECLSKHNGDPTACSIARQQTIVSPAPIDQLEKRPNNILDVWDLNDLFCEGDLCSPIVGNVITHFDKNHMTATFSRSIVPVVEDDLLKIVHRALQYKANE